MVEEPHVDGLPVCLLPDVVQRPESEGELTDHTDNVIMGGMLRQNLDARTLQFLVHYGKQRENGFVNG
jgi:hypothetical protein